MKQLTIVSTAVLLMLGTVSLTSSCYYDDEATLYPSSAKCDSTSAGTFSADILPLMNSRCNGCHSGAFPSGGIALSSYNDVLKYANDASLLGSVTHASGFSPMPKNGGKLSACQIQTIQSWIEGGALNN